MLGAALTASIVDARSTGLLSVGGADVSIDLPGGSNLPSVDGDLPACSDLADNDGDRAKDLSDPGCAGPVDDTEYNAPAPPPDPGPGPGPGPGDGDPGDDGNGGGGDGPGDGGGTGGVGIPRGDHEGPAGKGERKPISQPALRNPDGTPSRSNPTLSLAEFGPAPLGVPNFMIDQFTIPPFLLPLYQACGTQYGIPWQVLASINRIETAFGTNLNVSSAGAVGWMQFLPSTWKAYGVDANGDGRKDPYNPYDAICAAARYLKAAGGETDLRRAIFAYNHADWYVDEVLLYARQYGHLPADLISSITGLTAGAHFPVAADARYADDISEREALRRAKPSERAGLGNVADVIRSSPTRRGINIYSHKGAPVVAVNDGVVRQIGHSERLGRYVVLQDVYGNRFTYAELGSVSDVYPVPKERSLSAEDFELVSPKRDAAPAEPATGGGGEASTASDGVVDTEDSRARLYAFPERPRNIDRAGLTGQLDALLSEEFPGYESFKAYLGSVLRFDRRTMEMRPLREGSKVVAGTVLGRIDKVDDLAPHVHFAIRPTGNGAPKIDPKPILDGWKLLEATAIYRAAGENPFAAVNASQILLMSKQQLERRVLADPRLEVYSCGRQDIRSGQIDRQVLATLEYLAERGFRLTVTSLKCGHSFYTSSGSVSHHSSGNAVDIAKVNGIPILGNQGRGSITEAVIRELLTLQGAMQPAQIISLMQMGGSTFAMADHADHIHIGFQPAYTPSKQGKQFVRLLKPGQWERLISRIAEIDNPRVPASPSDYALPARKRGERASDAHLGE